MHNPFVYGEIVPASAFVEPRPRTRSAGRRSRGGAENLPDLAAALWQVVADPPRAGGDGASAARSPSRSRSAASAPTSRFSKAMPGPWSRPKPGGSGLEPGCGMRSARRVPRSATRPDADRPLGARLGVVPRRADRSRRLPAGAGGVRAARQARRDPQPKVVVALDEFQAVAGFNGGSVEHALRAAVQHQREVGYVFAGSEPSLMERMLGPQAAVLQGRTGHAARENSTPTSLPRSSTPASRRSGIRAGAWAGSGGRRARGQPAVRRPAPRTRNLGRGARRAASGARRWTTCTGRLRRLLAEQQTMFEALWQRLTLTQRAALRAVVLEEGRELLSAEVRSRHRLGGPSSMQTVAGRPAARRSSIAPRGRPLHGDGFAAPGVDRQEDILTSHLTI